MIEYKKVKMNSYRKKIEKRLIEIFKKSGVEDVCFDFDKKKNILKKIEKNFSINCQKLKKNKFLSVEVLFDFIKKEAIKKHIKDNSVNKKIKFFKENKYYPTSYAQKRIWFLQKINPKSKFYNINIEIDIFGKLNIDVFKKSLLFILNRHESFRTNFLEKDGHVCQLIRNIEQKDIDIVFKYYSYYKKDLIKIKRAINKNFLLEKDFLFRFVLIKKSHGYKLFFSIHHIIFDGWSMDIFIKEFSLVYESFMRQKKFFLSPITMNYRDFSILEKEIENKKKWKKEEKYWFRNLSGNLPDFTLPTDKSRELFFKYKGARKNLVINTTTTKKIIKFCKTNNVTLFIFLLSILNITLSKYNGNKESLVGVHSANRQDPNKENIIGLFLNMLPIRSEIKEKERFNDYVKRIKSITKNAILNENYPLEKIIEKINIKRDVSRPSLFNVIFFTNQNYYNFKIDNNFFKTSGIYIKNNVTNFDLKISAMQRKNNFIDIRLEYNSELYREETIENFLENYIFILKNILEKPNSIISDLDILTDKKSQRLLRAFNSNKKKYPKNKTIRELFEAQAKKTPNNIAIRYENKEMTYQKLNEKANKLACFLRTENNFKEGDFALIIMKHSFESIISILAVLKCGGIYVPLGSEEMRSRIKHISKDCKAKIILSDYCLENINFKGNIINIKNINVNKKNESDICFLKKTKSSNPLCVIYTSGSTGKPKGVLLTNMGVLNQIYSRIHFYKITPRDKIAQNRPFGFVTAVWLNFVALLVGAKLILYSEKINKNISLLLESFKKDQIKIATIPTVFLYNLPEKFNFSKLLHKTELRVLTLGAEVMSKDLVDLLLPLNTKKIKIYNTYGQSECSGDTLHYQITKKRNERFVLAGKPFLNTRAYVLNQDKKIQPIGISGELYVSGDGLAKGYLNNRKKTKEVFLPHPFLKGEKIYRTGDLAKMHTDGNIEILGRIDHQIKIRGYRIEPGEIETNLKKHKNIKDVMVVAKEKKVNSNNNDKYLVAYYSTIINKSKKQLNKEKEELRDMLKEILPDYMIPRFFISLKKFPLSKNGKVDRRILPEPKEDDLNKKEYQKPKTEKEKDVAEMWRKVLNIKKIGLNDDFFNLGGHSLKAVQLLTMVNNRFRIDLGLKEIFQYPRLKEFSRRIEIKNKNKTFRITIPRTRQKKHYKLSYAQRRMFVLYKLEPNSPFYNINKVREIKGEFKIDKFKKSINIIIDRHESLRTNFKEIKGEPVQFIKQKEDLVVEEDSEFKIYDLRRIKNAKKVEEEEKEIIKSVTQKPFKLETNPLLRVVIIKKNKNKHILVISMHHIISDGWSMNVFYKELKDVYNALIENKNPNFKKLPIQYRDYAEWEQSKENEKRLKKQENYWLKEMDGDLPVLNLPIDKLRPAIKTYNGDTRRIILSKKMSKGIQKVSRETNTTLFIFLFAVYNVFLHKISGDDEIVVGTLSAGRREKEIENCIGFFVNTLAIRSRIDGGMSFVGFLQLVKEKFLDIYDNEDYPFENLIEKLNIKRDVSRNRMFDTLFQVFQLDDDFREIKIKGAKVKAVSGGEASAKYDITFRIIEAIDNRYLIDCEYNTDLFNIDTIDRFLKIYKKIIECTIEDKKQKISKINILSENEKIKLLKIKNKENIKKIPKGSVYQIFKKQARDNKEKIAIEYENKKLTFSELEGKVNSFAAYLKKNYKIKKGDIVSVFLERSIYSVVCVLSLIKIGAVFVPIDISYPKERVRYILKNTKSKLIITDSKLYSTLSGKDKIKIIKINSIKYNFNEKLKHLIHHKVEKNDLACLIYTSGSTGRPKGVMLTQGGLVNYTYTKARALKKRGRSLSDNDIICQTAPTGYVISLWQMFLPLLYGARLIIYKNEITKDPFAFFKKIERDKVNLIQIVPSFLWAYLDVAKTINEYVKLDSLKEIQLTGETVQAKLVKDYYKIYKTPLINVYGSSEISDDALHYEILDNDNNCSVKSGQAIIKDVYLLDKFLNPVPIGVSGNIYVSGENMSLGYWRNKEESNKVFLKDPFKKNKLMYKMGDNAKIYPDGNIEVLGRSDYQVNLHGNRIELGEIEYHVQKYKGVDRCIAGVKGKRNDKIIVAWIKVKNEIKDKKLLEYLKKFMPEYMMPSLFVRVEKFPLNAHGKIDRKKLKIKGRIKKTTKSKPKGLIERRLAKMWREILGTKNIKREDNFFMLGGHSLRAIQLMARINSEFKIGLTLRNIFEHQEFLDLASFISKQEKVTVVKIKKAKGKIY